MSDFLGSVGDFFSGGGGKLLETGLTGAGLLGNIAAEKQRSDLLKQLNNPAVLSQKANQLAGNLDPALVQAVNNQVGGTLAEEGLSQSPGIVATGTAQALAPFIQQNQNTALQAIMQSLGMQLGGLPQSSNLAPLLALLTKGQQPGSASGYSNAFSGFSPDQWAAELNGGTPQFPTSNPSDLGAGSDFLGGGSSGGDFFSQ